MHRLKMVVNTVKQDIDAEGKPTAESISMSPVYSEKPDSANKQWSQWTPSGQLQYYVTNPAALGKVRPGMFFYVDLTLTDKDSL
jgi:hypothetical protein